MPDILFDGYEAPPTEFNLSDVVIEVHRDVRVEPVCRQLRPEKSGSLRIIGHEKDTGRFVHLFIRYGELSYD